MRVPTVDEMYQVGFHVEPCPDNKNLMSLCHGGKILFSVFGSMKGKEVCKIVARVMMDWRKTYPEWDKLCKEKFDKTTFWQRFNGIREGNFTTYPKEVK